eukprot:SAG11_NODE_26715_length_341_cov_1.929752_1_plen_45_part_00
MILVSIFSFLKRAGDDVRGLEGDVRGLVKKLDYDDYRGPKFSSG